MKIYLKSILFVVLSLLLVQNAYAKDHEPPFIGGEYWEVTGIKLADGGQLKYAKWLASEWRKNLDYAVSEGWLSSYKIFQNVHARADEPDIYLVRAFENMPSVNEDEERRKKWMEWSKKTMEKMENESGDRAEYRTVMSTVLLQEMNFRNK